LLPQAQRPEGLAVIGRQYRRLGSADPRVRRRLGMGRLGAAAAFPWNCSAPPAGVTSSDCSIVQSVVGSMQLPWGAKAFANGDTLFTSAANSVADPSLPGWFTNPAGCFTPSVLKAENGQPATAQIVGDSVSGIALKIAPLTGPAAPFVALGGALVGLFTALFNNHIQNDIRVENAICPAVPAALEAYNAINTAVSNGTITPATGSAALDQLVSEFTQQVQPGIYMSPTQCNAGCIYIVQLKASVAKMKAIYANQPAVTPAAASPVTSAITSLLPGVSAGTVSSWLPLAAIAGLVWAFSS